MQFQKKQMVRFKRNNRELKDAVVLDIIKCDCLVNYKENWKKSYFKGIQKKKYV